MPRAGRMTSVLVVDARADDREQLVSVLRDAGYRVFEAASGDRGLELARANRPDLVIADILVPEMDGHEFVRKLRSAPSTSRIPVLLRSGRCVPADVTLLADACGASPTIVERGEPAAILSAVASTLAATATGFDAPPAQNLDGEQVRSMNARLLERIDELRDAVILAGTLHHHNASGPGSIPPELAPAQGLSTREREVLALLAQGATNAEIATRLVISATTVQSHVKHILRKLGARNRTEAAVRYARGA
jgi:DNA-binding NarL/FixJ family response regulator